MKFDDFLNQAWNDHATKATQVANRLADGISLIEKSEQISQMAHLINHVFGEHLGQWENGIQLINKLKQLTFFEKDGESGQAIARAVASLELALGNRQSIQDLSMSDQIRVLAIAASALSGQKNPEKAQIFFREALQKAEVGIQRDDPANRALAVTGNNLACSLEEKNDRTSTDTELMILAAKTGRKYWEIAGTWKEVTWAEYRLAMTYLKANNLIQAFEHSQTCLKSAQENKASALEMFFGYEVLTLVEKARHNSIGFDTALDQAKSYFEKLSDQDKAWCEPSLQRLQK